MPEGDTIFRTARTLHRALAGRTVTRFESVFPRLARVDSDRGVRGRLIDRVTARGKHLFIWLSGDLVLRTHLRMHGSWHIYRPGERWMRPARDMRIVLGTGEFDAVAFDVPVAELVTARELERQPTLRDIGPDPLGDDFDATEAVRRIAARVDVEIADALLDQSAIAGIGNIWKSETLFACGVSPFARVRELHAETIDKLVSMARKRMRASVAESSGRNRLLVYGRGGQLCRRCGTRISVRKQGPNARATYWCERCQPPVTAAPLRAS
jgi:endonuclease-8